MAKEKAKTELVQTKGTWRAVGLVNRIAQDKAYTEGEFDKGKNIGKEWKSLRFAVKTSEVNELFVELFGMEKDAYAYKPVPKEEKKKNPQAKGTTKKIAFENRDNVPEGYNLIGVKVGKFEDDEADKKKVILQDFVEYDAVEEIFQTFDDGDSISLSGELQFSEYEDQQGDIVKQTKYIIKYASKLVKPVDFSDEKFEETSSFEQEIVFVGSAYDKKTGKLTVIGRTIQYGGKFLDIPFVIYANEDKVKQVANAFHSKLKFGDFVKVLGLCVNKTETVEVEEVANKDSIFGDGGVTPKGQGKRTAKNRLTEMVITGVDLASFKPKRYKLEDFIVEEELVDDKDIDDDNPFASSDEEDEDEELPFA